MRGQHIPKRRFTAWAGIYFALFVALPILGVAFVLDVALYLATRDVDGACLALLCMLD